MSSILSVNPEKIWLDIRVAQQKYLQQHKTPTYDECLQSEQEVSNPRLPPVVLAETTCRVLTRFSPKNGTAEHHILYQVRRIISLKRVRISIYLVHSSHLHLVFLEKWKSPAVSTTD